MARSKISHEIFKVYLSSLIFVFLLSTITILVLCRISYAYYFYIFILGFIISYYLLRETQFKNIIYLMLLSFLIGSGVLIILSGIIAIIYIKIRLWLVIIPVFSLILIIYKFPVQLEKGYFIFDISSFLLLGIAILSIISHVISIYYFEAPMLHDPMSHATWAKRIVDTGMINYFYSPGLHILSALGEMSGSFGVAKQVLILTNIFNALSFFPVFLFLQSYFNRNWFAIISSTLFVVASYPSNFFWTAGKNGLILAIPFLFLLLFFASLKMKTAFKIAVCNSLLIILVLIHYPSAFVSFIGIVIISFLLNEERLRGCLNYMPSTILGILYGIEKVGYKYQPNIISNDIVNIKFPSFSSLVEFSKRTFLDRVPFFIGNYLYIIGICGLLIMSLIMLKDKKYMIFIVILSANVLSMYIIYSVTFSPLLPIYSAQVLLAFCAIYIGVGFLIGEIIIPFISSYDKRFDILFYCVLFLCVVYFSYGTFIQYRTQQTRKNVVSQEDIAVFNWINNNLNPGQKIINNSITSRGIVFPTDGGAWLEVFTHNKIAMPFTDATLASTKQISQFYSMLSTDPASCDARNYFTSQGYQYYYQGSLAVYGPSIVIPQELLSNHVYKLLYQNGSARLFQISDCN
jgi:hypothetical protein